MTPLLRPTSAPPPRAGQKARPLLQVVDRPVRQPRDRRLLAAVGGALVFTAVLVGNVVVQAQTTQGQVELEGLQVSARQRQADYQQLRLRVAELEAPQRVVDEARRLGMIEPARVTYLKPTAITSAASRSDPSERDVQGPSGPVEREVQGPSGPVEREVQGHDSGRRPVPTGEAAGSWGQVKPILDRRR